MNIREIVEEFETMAKEPNSGSSFSIYKNPSLKEMQDAEKEGEYNEIRFIANVRDGKDVYVFNAEMLHEKAAREIGNPYKTRVHAPIWGDYAFGSSFIESGKLFMPKIIKKDIKRYASNETKEHLRKFFLLPEKI